MEEEKKIQSLNIKDRQEEAKENIKAFLEEQKQHGMIDCVIIGSIPGNKYHTAISNSMDRITLLGTIELAKLELYYSMKEDS